MSGGWQYKDERLNVDDYYHSSKFKVGDVVVLKNGISPIVVTEVNWNDYSCVHYIKGFYISTGSVILSRKQGHFRPFLDKDYEYYYYYPDRVRPKDLWRASTYEGYIWTGTLGQTEQIKEVKDDIKGETTMSNTNTLYQFTVKDNTYYGCYLATNSTGQWVMEEKGTGKVITVDKDSVEEVLPHTISLVFLGSSSADYHYLAEADKYKVGDTYVLNSNGSTSLVTITGVNTKSKKATVEFKPTVKILTEEVK